MADTLALPLSTSRPRARVRPASTGYHGDRDAFRSLYRDHAGALLAYAEHVTHDRMAAEDAVQETFLRAWRHLPRLLADERPPRPWLRTVLRRVLIDAARAARDRTCRLGQDAILDDATDGGFDAVLDRDLLATAMAHLSPPHHEVLVGTYYRDLPAEHLAAVLGVPVGTVRSRLHYALDALRSQLTEAMGSDGRHPTADAGPLSTPTATAHRGASR
jgi:RNA polymerase sigma-70 factor, ECF subfamily